ncbi:MAG: hypothetical protein SGPRY_005403 [Prymnesium sp.]
MAAAVADAEALYTTAADNLVNRLVPLDQFKENLGSADYVRWRCDLVHLAESAGPDFRAALVTLRAIPAVAHYADASVVLDTAAGAPVLTMRQYVSKHFFKLCQELEPISIKRSSFSIGDGVLHLPFCAIAAEARMVTQQADTTIADREAWRAVILKAISSHVASGARKHFFSHQFWLRLRNRELIAGKCRHPMEAKLNADALNVRCSCAMAYLCAADWGWDSEDDELYGCAAMGCTEAVGGVEVVLPTDGPAQQQGPAGTGLFFSDAFQATIASARPSVYTVCVETAASPAPPASFPAERSGLPVLDWVEGAVLSALPPVAASAATGAVVLGYLCLSRVWPRLFLFLPMLAPGEAVIVGEPLVVSCSFSAAELCAVPAAVVGANAGHPSRGWASRHDVGTWVGDSGAELMIGGFFLYPYSRVVAWSPEIFVKDVQGELTRVDAIVRTVVSLADGDHCVREVLVCDKFQIALWSCEYMSQFGFAALLLEAGCGSYIRSPTVGAWCLCSDALIA